MHRGGPFGKRAKTAATAAAETVNPVGGEIIWGEASMLGDQPWRPSRRLRFREGLDPVKYAEIERELEEREQHRRAGESAAAIEPAGDTAPVDPGAEGGQSLAVAVPAAPRDGEPTASGATDWGAVAEGLRGLAGQLRRVAAEGPGPSPG
jgi:hypothetical protein